MRQALRVKAACALSSRQKTFLMKKMQKRATGDREARERREQGVGEEEERGKGIDDGQRTGSGARP